MKTNSLNQQNGNKIIKIVVIGGTGLIGAKLVADLRERGHQVVAASPSSGVNTVTGEGVADALKGAQVVVDVANSPSFEARKRSNFSRRRGVTSLLRKPSPVCVTTLRCRGRDRQPAYERLLPGEDGAGEPD